MSVLYPCLPETRVIALFKLKRASCRTPWQLVTKTAVATAFLHGLAQNAAADDAAMPGMDMSTSGTNIVAHHMAMPMENPDTPPQVLRDSRAAERQEHGHPRQPL